MFSPTDKKLKISLTTFKNDQNDSDYFYNLKKATEIEDQQEGRLAVDVLESLYEIIIIAPMAGTLKDSIELHLHNDLLTLKGERKIPISEEATYHFSECYWGKFSRSIVLPADVQLSLAQAEYRLGLLVVRLPKVKIEREIPITIVEE